MARVLPTFILAIFLSAGSARAEAPPGMFASATEIAATAADMCSQVVLGQHSFEEVVESPPWMSVNPRLVSDQATHAWRIATLNDTYFMRLPNGGCSFSVEDGDGETMRALVVEQIGAQAEFALVAQGEARNGRATRFAYCAPGPFPYVVSMVVGQRRSTPHLVFNMFRSSTPAPSFCRPSLPSGG